MYLYAYINNKNMMRLKRKMKSPGTALWDKELLRLPLSSFSVDHLLLDMQTYPEIVFPVELPWRKLKFY